MKCINGITIFLILYLSFSFFASSAQENLIVNPGAELPPVGNGWTQVSGAWKQDNAHPPHGGNYYFYAGNSSSAELYQDIDISDYAPYIDNNTAQFIYSGYVQSYSQSPPDASREIVEFRNAQGDVLKSYDSQWKTSVSTWLKLVDTIIAPIGSRIVRVRLLTDRRNGLSNDGYHDDLSLTLSIIDTVKNKALQFDGVDDYVQLVPQAINNLKQGTIETWVYLNSLNEEPILSKQQNRSNTYCIFSIGYTANNGGYAESRTPGKVYFHAYNGYVNLESDSILTTGKWNHLAISFNQNSATLYLNGNKAGSAGGFPIDDVTSGIDARLGSWASDGKGFLDGKLDEFRIWNTARTQLEIQKGMHIDYPPETPGLILYYNMNASVTSKIITDSSLSNLSATLGNYPTNPFFVPSPILTGPPSNTIDTCNKYALSFDGSNDYVTASIPTTSSYTIEAYVKPASTINSSIIVGTISNPLVQYSHQIKISNGRFQHYLWDLNPHTVTASSQIDTTKWYHVAITASQNGFMKIYINGKSEGDSVKINTPWQDGTTFQFGVQSEGLGYFKGLIDEVRIWDVSLAPTEINDWKNKYIDSKHPEYAHLKGYWRMEEGIGLITVNEITGSSASLINMEQNTAWVTSHSPISCSPDTATKQTQTINFDPIPAKTFGDTPFVVHATASSGLPVSYEIVSGPALLSNDTVTITGTGAIIIAAKQAGNDDYDPAFNNQPITVIKAIQEISFTATLDTTAATTQYILSGTSSVGLPVTFLKVSGYGDINGNVLSFNGYGNVVVKAIQSGNSNYEAAESEVKTFCIAPAQLSEITGFRQTCVGQQKYSVVQNNGVTYNWSLSDGGALNTTNGNSVVVTWNNTGKFTLTVAVSAGCTSDSIYRTKEIQVITNINPEPVSNMFPRSGTAVSQFPFSLSWKPGANSEMYDVFIWAQGTTKPAAPIAADVTQIAYVVRQQNLPGFAPGKTYNWQVTAKNGCNTVAGAIQTFVVSELPNLMALNVDMADTINSGSSFDIKVEIKNIGKVATPIAAQWQDVFSFSIDSIEAHGQFLGAKPNVTALMPDSSYTTFLRATMREDAFGPQNLLVKTNAYGQLSESNLADNVAYKAFFVNPSPAADLGVASVAPSAEGFSGEPLHVLFTIQNVGVETYNDSIWRDDIFISPNPVFNEDEAIRLLIIPHYGKLAANGSYTIDTVIVIPPNIFGSYYIYVKADATDLVYERGAETNNTDKGGPVIIHLKPPPDFVVTLVNAPATAAPGEVVKIDYGVQNVGASKPALFGNSWKDAIFISAKAPFVEDDATRLTIVTPNPHPAMEAGDSYYNAAFVQIPADIKGKYYVYVFTDYGKDVFEYYHDDNNTLGTAIQINSPDLSVSTVEAPDSASSGNNITVNWTVINSGNGKVLPKSRTDRLWLSKTNALDKNDADILGSLPYTNAMDSGASVSKELSVKIKENASGIRYIFVETDADRDITEYDENNNISTGKLIKITSSPTPDLIVLNVTSTPDSVIAGNAYTLTYTIQNNDDGSITGMSWVDRVYRSPNPIFDNKAEKIRDVNESRTLLKGDTYTETFSIPVVLSDLSNNDTARWYFYVKTDIDSIIYETNETNNTAKSTSSLTITHKPYADLAVTQASGPDAVQSGKKISISWTTENIGGMEGLNAYWYDVVLFSTDDQYSDDDIVAGTKAISNPFANGNSYTQAMNITVPNGLSGDYHMLVVTDYTKLNKDISRSNNTKVIETKASGTGGDTLQVHITPGSYPNLTVNKFTAPLFSYSGQPVLVVWTISNIGDTAAGKSGWNENFYLSTDDKVDGGDRVLQSYTRNGDLAKNGSYTDSLLVFLPANVTGNFYLLLKTDGNRIVYETNEEDNTAASVIFIEAPEPSDLTVSNIAMPAQAMIGDSITVNWTLNNIGVNPSTGYLRQGIYISKNATWDKDDILLADFPADVNIAPSGDSSFTQSVKLTATQPYANYIIVRTDLLDNIKETNENNNIGVSAQTVNVGIPQLPIGDSVITTLKNNQPLYYKIVVPDSLAGETLLVSLEGESLNALNELYLKYDSIPTRFNYDFVYPNLVSGSQDIVIPALTKGEYYLQVYGSTSSPLKTQEIKLKAKLISFEILTVDAKEGGNTGMVTVQIDGAKFEENMQAKLTNSSLGTFTAVRVIYRSSTSVFATFNLNGAKTGVYDVSLVKTGIDTATLPQGFSIVPGSGGAITGGQSGTSVTCYLINGGVEALTEFNVDVQQKVKVVTPFATLIEFYNRGNVDVELPLVEVQSLSDDAPMSYEDAFSAIFGGALNLGIDWINNHSPQGTLRPGARVYSIVFSMLLGIEARRFYEYQLLGKK